jgi:hypothetical protein
MNCFCTIVTRSHLPYARALAESLRTSGNQEKLLVLVADSDTASEAIDNCSQLSLAELNPAPPADMTVYFDGFELCNALKPFLIAYALRSGAQQVIYLDADIYCVGSFARIWSGPPAALQLTPHHLQPPSLALSYIRESEVADMGFLNGGFARWQAGAATDAILRWMMERFPVQGFCDRSHGMFVDQKLLPLLLAYFPADVAILRDPGLNVAFWNLHERAVSMLNGVPMVAGSPVLFFHMSGYRLAEPEAACAYLPKPTNQAILEAAPWFRAVLAQYRELLLRHGADQPTPEYGHASHDGLTLTPALRRHYFLTRSLSPLAPAVLRIRFIDWLKTVRRWLRRHLF